MGQGKSIHLGSEYLESALRLLFSEMGGKPPNWYSIVINSFFSFFLGTFISALISGLILVWSEATLGRLLLIIAGGSFLLGMVFAVLQVTVKEETDRLRRTDPLSQLAEKVFSEASEVSVTQIVMYLTAISWAVGIGLLIHGVVAVKETSWLGLGLTFAYVLFAIAMGFQEYQKKRYLSQVARLSNELEEHLRKDEVKTIGGNISTKDFSLIVKAQKNEVKRIVNDLPELVKNTYSLVISDDVLRYLESLPENRYLAVHETIYSLQINPLPSTAQAVFGQTNQFTIHTPTHEISYVVDSVKHKVSVTGIRPSAGEEAPRGS